MMADDWGSWGAVPAAQTGSSGLGSGWDAPPPLSGQAAQAPPPSLSHEQQPSGEPTMGTEAARPAYIEQQGPGPYAPPSNNGPPPQAAPSSTTGAAQTNGWTPSRSFVHTDPPSEPEQPTATGHQQPQQPSNGFVPAAMNGNMSNAGSFSPREGGPFSIQQSAPLSPSVSGGWKTAPQSVGPGSGQMAQTQPHDNQHVPPVRSLNGSSGARNAGGGHTRTASGWITSAQVDGKSMSMNGDMSNGSAQHPSAAEASQNGYTAQQPPPAAAVQSPSQGSFGGPAVNNASSQNGFQQANGNLNGNNNAGGGWVASATAASQPPASSNGQSTYSNHQNGTPVPASNTGGGWTAPVSSASQQAGSGNSGMNGQAPTTGGWGAPAPAAAESSPASGQYGHSRSSSHANANDTYSTTGYGGNTSNGYMANGYGNGPGASFGGEKRGGAPVYAFSVPAEARGYLIGTGGANLQRITDETGIRVTRGRPKENGDPQDRDFLFFNDDNHFEEKVEEALLKVLKIVRSKLNDWLPVDGKAAEVARRLQEQGKLVDTRTQNSSYRQPSGNGYQNGGNGYQTGGQTGSGGSSYGGAGGWNNRQNDAGRDQRPGEAGPFRSSASNVGGTQGWGGMPAPNFSDSRSTVSKTGTQHPAARDLSINLSMQPNGQKAAPSASANAGSGGWQVNAPSFTPRNEAGMLSPAQSPVDTKVPTGGASASRWASNTQSNVGMALPSFNPSSGQGQSTGSTNMGGWTVGAGTAALAQQRPTEVPGAAPSEAEFRYSESVAGSNGHARNASVPDAQDQRYRQSTQDSGFGGKTSDGSAMPAAGQAGTGGKVGGWNVSSNAQAAQPAGNALKPLNDGMQGLNLDNAPPSGARGWQATNGPARPLDPVPSYGQPQGSPTTANGGWIAAPALASAGPPEPPAAPSGNAGTGWTAPVSAHAGPPASALYAPPSTYRSPTPQAAPSAPAVEPASTGGGIGWGEAAPAPHADSGAAQGGWGAPAPAPASKLSNGFSGPDSSARSYNDSIHPSDSVSNDNATTVGARTREPAYGAGQPNGAASYKDGQTEPAAQGGWGAPPPKEVSNDFPSNPAASAVAAGGGWGAPAGNGPSNPYSSNTNGNSGGYGSNNYGSNGNSYQSNSNGYSSGAGNGSNSYSGGGNNSYGGSYGGPPLERRFADANGSWASGPNVIPLRQNRWIQRGDVRPGADVVRPAVPEHIPGSGW